MSPLRSMNPVIPIKSATAATRSNRWREALVLLLFALFVWAGFWQLGRADQKKALALEAEAKARLPVLRLDAQRQLGSGWRYRRVIVTGVFEESGQILVDNQTFEGAAGYHVITPLRIATSGACLLVNRGWVSMGIDRRVLPRTETPSGEVEVRGVLDLPPGPRFSLGAASHPGPWWGDRWAYLDLDYYTRTKGKMLRPYVLLMDPETPYGYGRAWPRFETLYYEKYHMHLGYAVQWFVFAGLALAGLIGIVRSTGPRSG